MRENRLRKGSAIPAIHTAHTHDLFSDGSSNPGHQEPVFLLHIKII